MVLLAASPVAVTFMLPSRSLPIACVEACAVRLALLVHAHARAERRRSLLEVGAATQHTDTHTYTDARLHVKQRLHPTQRTQRTQNST